jgi:hypothetical protein
MTMKTNGKLAQTKNTNIYTTSNRNADNLVFKNFDSNSPASFSPQLKIKSHREGSFGDNLKEINVGGSIKQVPQIQMLSTKTHVRFASGSFIPITGKNGATLQTGRELKNLAALGTFDFQIKDARSMPNSARRELNLIKLDGKDAISNVAFKFSEAGGMVTDREKDTGPMSPKIASSRGQTAQHKYTKSEGKFGKIEHRETPNVKIIDQNNKGTNRQGSLNEAGEDVFYDNITWKGAEPINKKQIPFGTSSGINLGTGSNKEIHYEKSGSLGTGQKKLQQSRPPAGELTVLESLGGSISTRNAKADVTFKRKTSIKKIDNLMGELKQKNEIGSPTSLIVIDEIKTSRAKAPLSKGFSSPSVNNFYKSSVQFKSKGKPEF